MSTTTTKEGRSMQCKSLVAAGACVAAFMGAGIAHADTLSTTQAQIAAALPAAQAQIAVAQADGSLPLLDKQVTDPTLSPPSVHEDALAEALYNGGSPAENGNGPTTTLSATPALTTSSLGTCWGPVRWRWSHTILGGATVVWIQTSNQQWCGNGSRITYGENNWLFPNWSNYPYCLTDISHHGGWDVYPNWAHGGQWATTGMYSGAFVCVPILGSEHATLRVDRYGGWDHYDDFGF
jgi:hypothetical protein